MPTPDAPHLRRSRYMTNAIRRTVTAASAESSALPPGLYHLYCDVACRWRQGAAGQAAITTSTGVPLPAGGWMFDVWVTGATDNVISVIRISADGTLDIVPVDD